MNLDFFIKVSFIVLLTSVHHSNFGQKNSDQIAAIVTLDSFTVVASRQGFNILDFIDLVIQDTSFYQAFRNLRTTDCEFSSSISARHNLKKELDIHNSNSIQEVDESNCREMHFVDKIESSGFRKRKQKHQYYTAELYENIFFTKGKICAGTQNQPHSDNRIEAIKRFMFSPGDKVDLPIIGNKTGIFEEKNLEDYSFSISHSEFEEIPVYIFSSKIKNNVRLNKYLINSMDTYFSRNDFSVVYRKYHLQFKNGIVNCDIKLSVSLTQRNGINIPKKISYKGFWNIPFKRKEEGSFTFETTKFGKP